MANPLDLESLDFIRFQTSYYPKPILASYTAISNAIHRYYKSSMTTVSTIRRDMKGKSEEVNIRKDILNIAGEDGPITALVNEALVKCLKLGASDVHFEPYEEYMRIRLRIDGALKEIARPPSTIRAALTSRIKIMADMNIAETRMPQDGAINIKIGDKPIDFRVNSMPTVFGEKIVMRILDKSNLQVDMTQLGFEQDELAIFKRSISNPFGMVLVTGPTGSGKTTTLYSALAELNKESRNIITAEDPVEYNLQGVNQVQVKPSIGFDFASALKAFLRQDPDIIMVGEIRDLETANIGIKAALTGHLMLSTLHTNSATDTISRLLNMGVESFNLVAALICITAQRLMKKNCQHCLIEDDTITPEILLNMGIPKQYINQVKAYKGKGCIHCNNSGTKGRVAIHEVLEISDPIKEAIIRGLPAVEIKKIAMAHGMRTLRQSALNKMAKGLSPAVEVTAVTAPDSLEGKKSVHVA
ncbi:MAG: Flp pilus assembly complex ATPase component TadA [Oligoflexales bacterium]|nr:Flp pilus assembly complex ATPase component TadA [Oligoflexales bacterium]